MRSSCFLVAVIIIVVLPQATNAQQNVGGLRGVVKDSSGGVLVGASVVLRHQETSVETKVTSNHEGAYLFSNLNVGFYTLTVSFDGFRTARKGDLRIVSGVILTHDIDLAVGETSDVVDVSAQAEVIDTTSGASSTTRTLEEIQDLPLAMSGTFRSTNSYLLTMPGVIPNSAGGDGDQQVGRASFMGSGRGGFSNNFVSYTIDGVSATSGLTPAIEDNGQLLPELVEEIRLVNNVSAESGGNLGVGVALISKSGTNKFHGSLFEYHRSTVLDARPFFAAQRSANIQNEYGFVLGGPVVKDKMFFFSSWDQFKYRVTGAGLVGTVPSALMRTGDFSEWLGPQAGTDALGRPIFQGAIYDPLTTRPDGKGGFIRDPFPNNVIPSSRFSPVSRFFQDRIWQEATSSGTQNNWRGSALPQRRDYDRFAIKIDNHFWQNHRLSIGTDFLPRRRNTGASASPPTGAYSASTGRQDKQYRVRVTETWTARPNLVVNFRVAFNRYKLKFDIRDENANLGCESGLIGTASCALPVASIQNMSGFGVSGRTYRFWTEVPANLDVSLHNGRHGFKFGVEFMQQVATAIQDPNSQGTFNFNATETRLPGSATTGVGYASFLLGQVNGASMQTAFANKFSARYLALFAQDQWQIAPKLTLSYGLRWDVAQPISEAFDRMGTVDLSLPNPAAGGRPGALTFWGEGAGRNGRRSLFDTYWKAFGPRLGLAYSLNQKTVLRAYYGLLYAPILGDFAGGEFIPAYGWLATVSRASVDGGITPAFNWSQGFPVSFPLLPLLDASLLNGSGLNVIMPSDNRPARNQSVGFVVEREFPGRVLLKAEYVGKWTHGLLSQGSAYAPPLNDPDVKYLSLGNLLSANINSAQAQAAGIALPYPGFTGSVAQALRPFPQYLGLTEQSSRSFYNLYNAMVVSAQKHFGSGVSFLVGYTVSKQLERGSVQHRSLLGEAKTLVPLDRPQSLNLSYSYELPLGPGKRFLNNMNPIVRYTVGGWQVSGIHTYAAGTPLTISSQAVIPGFSAPWVNRTLDVPVQIGDCGAYDPTDASRNRYLNIAAFSTPAPFSFGNTRVLPDVRSCGLSDESITVVKNIPVREGIRVRFGAALFNIFNRHSWGAPAGNINNPATFGLITTASGPRNGQLWLRLEF